MATVGHADAKQMPGAKIVRLADTVNYQDGAVVSRTVVKRATSTITIFAFDAGQGLSEHTASFDALVQILEGRAEITISGQRFQLQSGDAIVLPAHQPHAVNADSAFKMLMTMIRS